MRIRSATLRDIPACRQLDGSTVSDAVWNMQQTNDRDSITIVLSEVRLPRTVELPYPLTLEDLDGRLERGDLVLVAEEGEALLGCLAMSWRGADVAVVDHVLVMPDRRRQGTGRALVREAVRFARDAGLRVILAPCQAKNGPAIAFYRRLGLEFCGYNEQQYADHDVTLLFAYRTR